MELRERAQQILNMNWRNGYTVPSQKLYPFQWNWDSGFIAIGYAAMQNEQYFWQEIEYLIKGQWQNGFLPHIIYHNEEKYRDQYFPNADVWASSISGDAPESVKTSGIAQPPVLAFALQRGLRHLQSYDQERLRTILPSVAQLQSFYRNTRNSQGAISIYHPWESGMDNSPLWDFPLQHIGELQKWHHLRRDLEKVDDPSMRPTHKDYDAYLTLVDHLKTCNYDPETIRKKYPFQVKDILASAFFIAGEQSLAEMQRSLDIPTNTATDVDWQKMFHDPTSDDTLPYHNYDVCNRKFLPLECPYALFFLLTDHVSDQYKQQVNTFLQQHQQKMSEYPYPNLHASVYPWSAKFVPNCYWKGPMWININWTIYCGLKKHGLTKWSTKIREQILKIVDEQGFYEYFHPISGEGLGADNFSWTAALVLDLLNDTNE
ncbi:MGH1-like glycoside hydrolase domain-containing protein [Candidatus Uabimicrobium amorphum]|uniref:Mannosylglycerate hydrolase MGH1-like glycoside hydrolase domain-containing protein n=1 Tax=Uabimicrobium amorphum TaxID=2596890 RepID=A0A5S9IXA8_UABAM|nr:hypothetical protein [Candidatus Uabimicrobium amorphum]BBM88225.1 hypothetical protein UABAM_06646 [Candidatus Uabimicrobium amorphum]